MTKPTALFEQRVLTFMGKQSYKPLKQHEMAREMKLKSQDRSRLRHTLRDLEHDGKVMCIRKNRWSLPDAGKHVQGELRVHPQGFGFLTPEGTQGEDIFVPPPGMGVGMHGDIVLVSVLTLPPTKSRRHAATLEHRTEGKVLRVVERRTKTITGMLKRTSKYWYVIPDNLRLNQDVRVIDVDKPKVEPIENHKVVVRLEEWTDPAKPLTGELIEDLGDADAPGVDVLSVIRDYQLETEFPATVIQAAKEQSTTPTEKDLEGRRDLRDLLTFTIDPDDAKDYDDAVSLAGNADKGWVLGVHIADVAHYVTPDSTIDREARVRGNTIYLVDRTISMLPPYLTKDVCSLIADVDRLTHSVFVTLDRDGKVLSSETCRSVIHSSACLSYDQVQKMFDGKDDHKIPKKVLGVLEHLRPLVRKIRNQRIENGAIDLSMPEVKIVLDDQGKVSEIRKRSAHEAYNLIEECMLLANCAVAQLLMEKEIPAIYRVHDEPDEEQWIQMGVEVQSLGFTMVPQSRDHMNIIARKAVGSPLQYAASLALLRNLKRAMYAAEPRQHFGLAFLPYTHFTSPIRRYADLIVHRILNSVETGQGPPYSVEDAAQVAVHVSRTERTAADAEEESIAIKRVEYYQDLLRKGETGPYKAYVTSIVKKGLLVELSDTLQRGLVPFASLDDYFRINATGTKATGSRSRLTFGIGDPVNVDLVRVDTARRLVDFMLLDQKGRSKSAKKKGKKHRKGKDSDKKKSGEDKDKKKKKKKDKRDKNKGKRRDKNKKKRSGQ